MTAYQLRAAQMAHAIVTRQLKEIPEHDTVRRKILTEHQAKAKSLVDDFSIKVKDA